MTTHSNTLFTRSNMIVVAFVLALSLLFSVGMATMASAGVIVERVGPFDENCSCAKATLKINGKIVPLGTNGLTSSIALSERDAVAWAAATYGTDVTSVGSQGGGGWDDTNMNGIVDAGEESSSGGW